MMETAISTISVVVLEVELHCEGCSSNIIAHARTFKGVENVTADINSNKLTVEGKLDSLEIQEYLRLKIKKNVSIVSAQPRICDTAADGNRDDRISFEKQSLERTIVVVKLGHNCQGCGPKIRKIVEDTIGVQEMSEDEQKETVTIKGTMDPMVLIENLKERLNIPIEILSIEKEKYSNGSVKGSGFGSDDGKKKKGSGGQENGINGIEMEESIMKLGPEKASATATLFKVPLHCDGCIRKIRKIIRRIRGVQQVIVIKGDETIAVKATIDVKVLTVTMKKRLKKLVEERKIKILKEGVIIAEGQSLTIDHKQESSTQATLQLSEPEIIQIFAVQDLNEGWSQGQSPVTSRNACTKIDPETGESSPSSVETTEWSLLIGSLLLEGVSALLDQLGYLLVGMVLSFVGLFISTLELVNMARREGLITLERGRSTCSCFCCRSTDTSPPSELFVIVHIFGLACAVWQCIYSIVQYIYTLHNLDNPIKMSLLPFIFFLCVLISKKIRKMEEVNCQETRARAEIQHHSDLSQFGDASLSSMELGSVDHRQELTRKIEQNVQMSKRMETKIEVQSNPSEPVDHVSPIEFVSDDFGCSHYRSRCKIRAPCCNGTFDCWHRHDEAKNAMETNLCDKHCIPSHEVIKVICSLCGTEQDVQQNCIRCGVCMGKYFCAKCKLFDNDVSKNQYHCDECEICRILPSKVKRRCTLLYGKGNALRLTFIFSRLLTEYVGIKY
ncbi:uncharacterized protein LOC105628011 isoform X5 [Jatropha curcas]|uniref:uncharacterized protein LOC105628011 isoform X5 n=1 Tax=Jatropha curcas TaxID=180498 RepID=UPI00189421ED|nr:uncharacterized protein LOC105628011 isoform X5 [Jatropha curcas]